MRTIILLCLLLIIKTTHSQNVGIGTINPLFKLDVRNGSINTDSVYRIGGVTVMSVKGTQNVFIGEQAGRLTTGSYNGFFGYRAGYSNTIGYDNSFFGTAAGFNNTSGYGNSFFGRNAGAFNNSDQNNSFFGNHSGFNNTGSSNSFFGADAGYANSGYENCFFGRYAGYSNSGSSNCFFGRNTGDANTMGSQNSFFGESAGSTNTIGDDNSFFGRHSGGSNLSGESNSFFGIYSGNTNSTGNHNSFFGAGAGSSNTTGTNLTMIGAGAMGSTINLFNATAIGRNALVSQNNSLVLGSIIGLNGATVSTKVGIGVTAPQSPLHIQSNSTIPVPQILIEENTNDFARLSFQNTTVAGKYWTVAGLTHATNASARLNFFYLGVGDVLSLKGDGNATLMGTLTQLSDSRMKKDIIPLNNSLNALLQLNGYRYNWKDTKLDQSVQIGLLAQEVQKIFPELVKENEMQQLSMNYSGLIPVLVEAFKEQQQIIEKLQKRIEDLENKINR